VLMIITPVGFERYSARLVRQAPEHRATRVGSPNHPEVMILGLRWKQRSRERG